MGSRRVPAVVSRRSFGRVEFVGGTSLSGAFSGDRPALDSHGMANLGKNHPFPCLITLQFSQNLFPSVRCQPEAGWGWRRCRLLLDQEEGIGSRNPLFWGHGGITPVGKKIQGSFGFGIKGALGRHFLKDLFSLEAEAPREWIHRKQKNPKFSSMMV